MNLTKNILRLFILSAVFIAIACTESSTEPVFVNIPHEEIIIIKYTPFTHNEDIRIQFLQNTFNADCRLLSTWFTWESRPSIRLEYTVRYEKWKCTWVERKRIS